MQINYTDGGCFSLFCGKKEKGETKFNEEFGMNVETYQLHHEK